MVIVVYSADIIGERILEDDFVYCYGTFGGLYTYESVLGQSITVPIMYLDHIERRV